MKSFTSIRPGLVLTTHTVVSLKKAAVVLMGAALAIVLYSQFSSLTTGTPVFIDESWNANSAWNWAQTGINFDSMHAGTLDQVGHEWLRWPKLGNLPWRLTYSVFGLGLFQARIISWSFGVVLVIAVIAVGRELSGWPTGILAALILSLSGPFFQAAHYARWDMMLAAWMMIAFWLALRGMKKERWWLHALAGLLSGLALDIHQNAVLFLLGFAALYLVTYGKKVFRERGTWFFALGALSGIGYFLAAFILPDPAAYFNLFGLSLGNTHVMPLTTFNLGALIRSLDDEIGRYHFFENSIDFALLGASVIYLLLRWQREDRQLLIFITAVFAGFVLIIGNKHDIYAILLYPFFMLLVAKAITHLAGEQRPLNKQSLFTITLVALFLFSRGVILNRTVSANENYNYGGIIAQIEPHIPADATVMGLPVWWLGLSDYHYSSSLNLTYYHILNGLTLEEGLNEIRPDVIILDRDFQELLVDEGAYQTGAGFAIYQLPRQEFELFLTHRGQKVAEFWDPWHGNFEIYVIDWVEE